MAQRQPQAPPQQPPPPWAAGEELARPPTATVESSFTVSSWPCGQLHGADDSLIGRVCSKVAPQARQRYSYRGTASAYALASQPAGRRQPDWAAAAPLTVLLVCA